MIITESLRHIPLADIKPNGWLLERLKRQAVFSKALPHIWKDLKNNAWAGGTGEAWERGPYYLDGIVPLAYILGDPELIAEVKKYVDAIIASQRPDGSFGPERNPDHWPRMVVMKAMVEYHRATSDERVLPFLAKYLEWLYNNLRKYPLKGWAFARALEGYEAIDYVYRHYFKSFLPRLIDALIAQMFDWFSFFKKPYQLPTASLMSRPMIKMGQRLGKPFDERAKASQKKRALPTAKKVYRFNNVKLFREIMKTHGVNIAMALKYPVVIGAFRNRPDYIALAKNGLNTLLEAHGTALSIFTADEHLSGKSPSQGIELCAIVELMYTCEETLRLSDDLDYASRLEFLAFNALPGAFTNDMLSHQYVEQPNQVEATVKARDFFDTGKDANIFGLEPNYGCCTANLHQGYPKFTRNLVFRTNAGLSFRAYAPFELNTVVHGDRVIIRQLANYPFENKLIFEFGKSVKNLQIDFRIPFYKYAIVDFRGVRKSPDKRLYSIKGDFREGERLVFELNFPLDLYRGADGSVSIKNGNLLLALPLEPTEKYLKGERPFHDREFTSVTDWHVAPISRNREAVVLKTDIEPDADFEHGYSVTVKGRAVLNWKMKHNSADRPPTAPVVGEERELTLVPYGGTVLHISQFPFVGER